jgi:DNA-binding GntR family transcriptional regulator
MYRTRGESLVEAAYNHIRAQILNGDVRPGARIDLNEVRGTLEVSHQPVRDAVNRLAAEGFVEVIPQVGCRVRRIGRQDVEDFLEVFAGFEGRMASFAAFRATDAEILELTRISKRIRKLWPRSGAVSPAAIAPKYRILNRELHTAIHAAAHSPSLKQLALMLMDRYDFYIACALGEMLYATRPDAAHEEHEAVLAAIAARDAKTARATMERHILNSIERVLESARRLAFEDAG